jgi:spermidine synthase
LTSPTNHSGLLKACLFATGCSGIVAEFTLSTLASYILGNTTLQWTLIMSLMLFTMGVGSRISRYLTQNLLDTFITIEFALSTLCATCAIAAYFGTAWIGESTAVIYGYAGAIGLLIGMEIPIVARMNETYEGLRTNIASVMEKDYYGALVGGLLFAFFALPKLGLTYTPIALGAVNFIVASILYWRFRRLTTHRGRLQIAFWSVGLAIVVLGIFAKPIILFGEQSRYRDRIVFTAQTPYQKLVITEWNQNHWLFINGNIQFSTYDEERYHEPLVHPAIGVTGVPEEILILGGGDGLALREVLKYESAKHITLVDLDPEMTELGKSHPILLEANDGAFADLRVEVIHQDAGTFVAQTEKLYDVIIIDLPDPKGPDLARLYALDFYRDCHSILSREGTLVTQASSPLHANKAFLCILKTIDTAGFAAVPYQNAVPTMGTWGWVLARKSETSRATILKRQLEQLDFSGIETEFLNNEAMIGMLQFWKGAFDNTDALTINTMMDPVIDQYYNESNWGF